MLLTSQIQDTIIGIRNSLPEELNALAEQGAGEISALDITGTALKLGEQAPAFELPDYQGQSHSLQQLLEKGPVVLTFYRGAWCPYCNLQLAAYNSRLGEIRDLGAELVAITPESNKGIEAFLESDVPQEAKDTITQDPDFPVLHDKEAALAKQFGLVFTLPESHKKLLSIMKLDVEKALGTDTYALPDPATYIVGKDGLIKWAFVPNNYRKRAEPQAIIDALKTL